MSWWTKPPDLSRVVEEYERLLTDARETLTTVRAERDEAIRRGDLLMDKLLEYAGQRGLSAAGRAHDAQIQATTQRFLANQDDDPFAEVPLEQSRYADRPTDALIDPAACEPEESYG